MENDELPPRMLRDRILLLEMTVAQLQEQVAELEQTVQRLLNPLSPILEAEPWLGELGSDSEGSVDSSDQESAEEEPVLIARPPPSPRRPREDHRQPMPQFRLPSTPMMLTCLLQSAPGAEGCWLTSSIFNL